MDDEDPRSIPREDPQERAGGLRGAAGSWVGMATSPAWFIIFPWGLFFAGPNLSVSEQTELEFELSDTATIKATCQVLYRKRHGNDAGIGVRFLVLDSSAEGTIARFLATHEVLEASPAVTRALRELPLEEPKASP